MKSINELELLKKRSSRIYLLASTSLGLGVLIYLWFSPWMVSAFYGDDLDYYLSYLSNTCGTHIGSMLSTVCHERFRPLAFAVISSEITFFSKNLALYFTFNVVLQALVAFAALLVALRLSRSLWVAVLFSLIISVSRFAAYEVTQVIGPIESLASLCSILAVYFLISAEQEDKVYRVVLAIFFSLLAALSHERCVVLAVWLALAIAIAPASNSLNGQRRWVAVGGAILVPVAYVLYKQFFLDTPFLIGTGGTHLSTNYKQVFGFGLEAVLSILGFNSGEVYLVGVDVFTLGDVAILSVATALSLVTISVSAYCIVVLFKKGGGAALRWPLLLLLLGGLLLGPGLLTIRLEQRWLFLPFVFYLLCIASLLKSAPPVLKVLVSAVIAVCSIWLNHQIMQFYDRLFFVSSPHFASMVERDIIKPGVADVPRGGDLAFVAEGSQCRWSLLNGEFFKAYEGEARHVSCFSTVDAAIASGLSPVTPLFVESGGRLLNISNYYRDAFNGKRSGDVKYDFLADFSEGEINSEAPVDTPTRRGVLTLPWDTVIGRRETITILSGFSFKFPRLMIQDGEQLEFGVGMVFHAPQSARAKVSVEEIGGGIDVVYADDLVDPAKGEALRSFNHVDIDLSKYKGRQISVIFSVESPGGNSDSHWVGFASPRLVLKR